MGNPIQRGLGAAFATRPSLYKVEILDTAITPRCNLYETFMRAKMRMSQIKASESAHKLFTTGRLIIGPYTYEVAETKQMLVEEYARKNAVELEVHLRKLPSLNSGPNLI